MTKLNLNDFQYFLNLASDQAYEIEKRILRSMNVESVDDLADEEKDQVFDNVKDKLQDYFYNDLLDFLFERDYTQDQINEIHGFFR